ncbi:uncharacterized protein LOC123549975 [Mercenaria mercenaria]|uniref:uncharacterized protein LOC123549975 n=1 Tax=Mercenaria mercenaria TaxID=6596 RepID=UPI001E1DEAB3|nr:uncharacterized protein LOC123549975 [Mercenaria mercenaria]
MFMTGILFVLSFLVLGVPALQGHGATMMCRHCHNVKDPRDCTEMAACHESCVTDVHYLNFEYLFTYSCKHQLECGVGPGPLGKRQGPHHGHEHGQHVCRECCTSTGCDSYTCSKYFSRTTTPAPMTMPTTTATTTSDNGCRDYESPTFQCAELSKYNFCTDTASVAYAIAHEKCAKHCGFCSPYGTVNPNTKAPTTVLPSTTMDPTTALPIATTTMDISGDFSTTTVSGASPVVVNVNVTATIDPDVCTDSDDPTLTCADMLRFGFCSADSGSGYTFAKLRCRKTCQFC